MDLCWKNGTHIISIRPSDDFDEGFVVYADSLDENGLPEGNGEELEPGTDAYHNTLIECIQYLIK